jgi:TRC40/GET3/ArsA family transport-energizing ATPase
VSDAFGVKLSSEPQELAGVPGLWGLEIDPAAVMLREVEEVAESGISEQLMADFKEWLGSCPGIDEAMALSTVLSHVESGRFSVIVFDTAPTGHTLRLLSLPHVLKVGIEKLSSWKTKLSSMLDMVGSMFSSGGAPAAQPMSVRLGERLHEYHAKFETIATIFTDQRKTTFVCVCIAELLSVCETARLLEELARKGVSSSTVIVNQLLPPPPPEPDAGVSAAPPTAKPAKRRKTQKQEQAAAPPAPHPYIALCLARRQMQQAFVAQLQDAVKERRVSLVGVPLLECPPQGASALQAFASHVVDARDDLLSL